MKTLITIILFLLLAWTWFSEPFGATLEVARRNLETHLADKVGSGRVALELQRRRVVSLREGVVEARVQSQVLAARASALEERLNAPGELPSEEVGRLRERLESMRRHLAEVRQAEAGLRRALSEAREKWDELRWRVESLEERRSLLERQAGLEGLAAVEAGRSDDEVRRLVDDLERRVFEAEATLDLARELRGSGPDSGH